MAYTKTTWTAVTPLSVANFAHVETQADALDTEMLAVDHSGDYYTVAEYAARYWPYPGSGHGQGSDADKLNGMTLAEVLSATIPIDTIIMWHGNITAVPAGFAYCDGTRGTPDIRDNLPYCGGSSILSTGGASYTDWEGSVYVASHTLTIGELTRHLHMWRDNYPSGTTYCNDASVNDAGEYTWNSWASYFGGAGGHDHEAELAGSNYNYPVCKAVHFLIKIDDNIKLPPYTPPVIPPETPTDESLEKYIKAHDAWAQQVWIQMSLGGWTTRN